jgi:hypothetical protein
MDGPEIGHCRVRRTSKLLLADGGDALGDVFRLKMCGEEESMEFCGHGADRDVGLAPCAPAGVPIRPQGWGLAAGTPGGMASTAKKKGIMGE